jgi:hypothetical protein
MKIWKPMTQKYHKSKPNIPWEQNSHTKHWKMKIRGSNAFLRPIKYYARFFIVETGYSLHAIAETNLSNFVEFKWMTIFH